MTRGDSIFGRLDVSLLMDARWRQLTAAGKVTYLTLYLTAVEHRRSLLDAHYTPEALSDRTGLDQRTYRKALQKCMEFGLVKITPENRIFIPNVKENHEKMKWNDSGEFPAYAPDTGGIKGSEREIERQKEREKESNSEAASPCLPMWQAQRQMKEPTPEEVNKWQKLFPANNTPAKNIAMTCGKANMPKNKVFEEALKVMNPESIIQTCAWVEAYREINKITERADCAAILTNKLKDQLTAAAVS